MNVITKHIDHIKKLCRSNNVKSLYAFGSVLTEDFNLERDIDLLVDLVEEDPVLYAERYFNLKFELELLFERKINLLEQKALKNPYLKETLERTKVRIYG